MCQKKNGYLTKDYREILDIQYEFYRNLYESDANVEFNLLNETGINLSAQGKSRFDTDWVRLI